MRAKEFTINVPITISINGDEDPVISTDSGDDGHELQQNPVMVSPQQQELEMKKAELGKASPVIDKLTQDHTIGAESDEKNDILTRLRAIMNK